jgi:hypothetical protein
MNFPSLCKLFSVAAVFSVGIAAACGPYGSPICPAGTPSLIQSPGVYYYEPGTNAQGQTYYTPRYAPAQVPGTSLSIVNGKLHLLGMDGSKMTCEKFTILVSGVEPAEVSIADKQIKITSGKDVKDGDSLQATAQKVTRVGAEGATLLLEGGAKLVYVRKGKKLEAAAEGISLNLATGQVVSEMGAMPAAQDCVRPPVPTAPLPLPGTPAPPVVPSYPISPAMPYSGSAPSMPPAVTENVAPSPAPCLTPR